MLKINRRNLLIGLFILIMISDLVIHLLTGVALLFPLYNFKGDVNFTSLGILNWGVRSALIGLLISKKPVSIWVYRALLLINMGPMFYLPFSTLPFFSSYVGMYFYWTGYALLTISILILSFFPKLLTKNTSLLKGVIWFLSFVLIIEYTRILGGHWTSHFMISALQHIVYEGVFSLFVLQLATTHPHSHLAPHYLQ